MVICMTDEDSLGRGTAWGRSLSLSAGMRNKTLLFVCLTSTVVLLALGCTLLIRSSSVRSAGAWASAGSLWSQLVNDDVIDATKVDLGTTWRQLSSRENNLIIAEL